MSENGAVTRKIDDLGRIVIPKELRNILDLEERDPVDITIMNDGIFLCKHNPACIFCGSQESLITYESREVCSKCKQGISQA